MKTKIAVILAMMIVTTACATASDPSESTINLGDIDLAADTDGDGLSNEAELAAGTSIEIADTDGDGYNDFTEVVDLSFDPLANPYRFNPVVADIPNIAIELVSAPDITVICSAGTGDTRSFSTSRSNASSSTVSTTDSGSDSQALAFQVTAGSEVEGSVTGIKAKVSYEVSASETNTSTIGWSETQSNTNTSTLAASQSYSQTNNETCTGGVVTISVSVENRGNIAFTLEDLVLSAFLTRTSNPGVLQSVGNLLFDTAGQTRGFPNTTLGPGAEISQLTFKNDTLDLATVTALLADSKNLTVEVASAEVTDSTGSAFAHSATTILANTATVILDYGGGQTTERFQVGANQVVGTRVVTLGEALRDDLRLTDEITVGTTPWGEGETASAISRIRSVANDHDSNAYWVLAITTNRGDGPVTTFHSPHLDGFDPDTVELRAGDTAHLAYIRDADRDGVDDRIEFLHGTDPDVYDTDADGLSDGEELRGWLITLNGSEIPVYSDPVLVDTDLDDATDFEEFEAGTHPSLRGQPIISGLSVSGSGQTINLDALGQDLDGAVVEIVIDWGDGTAPQVEPGTALTATSHTYADAGKYVVTVTAVDDNGLETLEPPTFEVLLPVGLAAHWPLNGNFEDAATGNYNASAYFVNFATDVNDNEQSAADLISSGQEETVDFDRWMFAYSQIRAPHVPFTEEFTMSAWFWSFNPRGNPSRIIGQGNWMSLYWDDTGRVNFGILNERVPDSNVIVTDPEPGGDSFWIHYAGTAERTDSGTMLRLYRNGVEVASRELSNVTLENPGQCNFFMGTGLQDVGKDAIAFLPNSFDHYQLTSISECDAEWAGVTFPGSIDDVRIYDVALSPADIEAMFEAGP